ncbi:IS3 family transposase [Pseudoalteromonas luteoviolacea]|uniref:IS3 family transposase n=1 Tax=Pseudoalteromonas luteoviolacea TaxID=43657 RepID=UPI003D7CF9CC
MSQRFTEEFKIQAVKQVTERGYSVASVSERLGVTSSSLYNWIKTHGPNSEEHKQSQEQSDRIKQLEKEQKRVTMERDILKGSNCIFRGRVKEKYTFIKARLKNYPANLMCKVLSVQRSGFYAWMSNPKSKRELEDERLTGLIKHSWLESGCVYGYRKVTSDLRDLGEACSKHRVAKLMKLAGIKAQVGYKKHKGHYSGKPAVVADNVLDRQFAVTTPNRYWVTNITYIRTHEGWLYLAVVLDLYSRAVVGWSMSSRMESELVTQALLAAVWRRKPKNQVLIHSDQGSQFTGYEWSDFLTEHNLKASMSRRGNCHDNAVAESFFQLLKRERVKRKIYATREHARADIFDYIEMFYNSRRKHGEANNMPPLAYEKLEELKQKSV